ncbi:hypothetical protein BX666DRAFT_1908817 [Dichotomocladium elegans]|nr:hypothetical protein BX666DRAFT_1908817 [Dichotomocladium elegans]
MPGKQLKTSKIVMDNNERGKKLQTPLTSSYANASRWMAKVSSDSRPTSPTGTGALSDEKSPSFFNSGDDVKKKRSAWNDSNNVKKKVMSASLPCGEDPFAGMNTRVDYQQEIERLKALVPKVEKKVKAAAVAAARPNKSTAFDFNKQPQRLWPDAAAREVSTKVRSSSRLSTDGELDPVNSAIDNAVTSSDGSPSSTTEPTLLTGTSAPAVDMSTSSTDEEAEEEEENPPGHVITEEEKLRFLEFVRSWTGCWQGWDRTSTAATAIANGNNNSMSFPVTKDSSLWAGRSPWEHEPIVTRRPEFSSAHLRHIQSDSSTSSFAYDPYLPFLHSKSAHPSVPTTTSRYYGESLYSQYDPQPVGTIGEKYRQPSTYRRDNGFGVFVV